MSKLEIAEVNLVQLVARPRRPMRLPALPVSLASGGASLALSVLLAAPLPVPPALAAPGA